MERHPTDFAALLFGLLFLATGGGFLAHEVIGSSVDPAWTIAIASIVMGCAFLATTLVRRRTPAPDDGPAPGHDEPARAGADEAAAEHR
jgi:hypothetical protein